jgi:cell division FtsZ-interacting protein ZapD
MEFQNESSLTNLRKCIDLANKALELGTATAEELDKQEQQLDRMDGNVDIIDTNVQNAHRTLDNISSFIKSLFGAVKYPAPKPSEPIKQEEIKPTMPTSKEAQKDDELDELYNITVRMKDLNISINKSLDRQTEKIQKLNSRVDNSNIAIKSANEKIDKLL